MVNPRFKIYYIYMSYSTFELELRSVTDRISMDDARCKDRA